MLKPYLKSRHDAVVLFRYHGWRRFAVELSFRYVPAFALLLSASAVLARDVIDQTGRRVNIPDHPQRIVSLAPSITETLYALGLADRLVGDTDYCDYPLEARAKPHVGAMLNPNLEKIVALKPDLVLGTDEANRRETADQLARLGIPLYGLTAHTLEGTIQSIEDLGRMLGGEQPTQKLVARLRERVEAVEKRVQGRHQPKVLVCSVVPSPDHGGKTNLHLRCHPSCRWRFPLAMI